jgi:REP element-mobilizing transposase RayT
VEGRARVLDNDDTFQRLTAFLLDSPARYRWFGRRFVVMPDHIHLIAHMGQDAIRLGQWIKALKAVVGGLERCASHAAASVGRVPPRGVPVPPRGGPPVSAVSGDAAGNAVRPASVGRVPPRGVPVPSRGVPAVSPGASSHEFSRIKRSWRWQDGFHDHKFRTPESESRKWEYVCLNPVRYGLVNRPEQWPYGGEVFYDDAVRPRLLPGTPSLLETGLLIEEQTPREGTRPATL